MTTIVFHTSVSSWQTAIDTFQGGSRLVSAHYVVDRDIDQIAQCVRETDTAWHAGNWPVNQGSIGIERADYLDYWNPGPPAQLDRIVALSLDIMTRNPITTFIRHQQATNTACPDGMDTAQVILRIKGGSMALSAQDKAYIDQRIRDIIMGEPDLTGYALKHYLASPHPLGAKAPKKVTKKSDVERGHGRG